MSYENLIITADQLQNGDSINSAAYYQNLLTLAGEWSLTNNSALVLQSNGDYIMQPLDDEVEWCLEDLDGARIIAHANYKFDENAVKAKDEIVAYEDGNEYYKSRLPQPSLFKLKEKKLQEIKTGFENSYYYTGHCMSSLGFEIDATLQSKNNVQGLIDIGEEPITFRDYNNEYHSNLTIENMNTIKIEISKYGLGLYEKKWEYEQLVEKAISKEDLDMIVWSD